MDWVESLLERRSLFAFKHCQGARKDGRGNEPLPLRNVRCAETPEDS